MLETRLRNTGDSSGGGSIGSSILDGITGSVLFVGAGPVLAQDNANFFYDIATGRLGLGTNSPQRLLHLATSSAVRTTLHAYDSTDTTDGNGSVISFRTTTSGAGGTAFTELAGIAFTVNTHDHATRNGMLQFATANAGAVAIQMTILGNGNIGIGTESPVSTSNYKTLTLSSTTGGQIVFQDDGVSKGFIYNNATDFIFSSVTGGAFIFYGETGITERLRIDSGGITLPDNSFIGLGSSSGRIAFDDLAADEIQFLNARPVIKNTSFPQLQFNDTTATRGYLFYDTTNSIMTLNRSGNLLLGLSIDSSDNIRVGGGATATELRFLEPSGSGTNYSAFKAQAQAASLTYTLPAAFVVGGSLTDAAGDGTLTWVLKANAALSNLASVAINTSLISDTDSTDDLGSTTVAWANVYADNIKSITGNPLTITPIAGQNLNISLSTTGDFAVNTDDLYVDTSAGRVGINTTAPGAAMDVIGTIGLQIRASDTTADATQKNFYLTARHYTNSEEDVCIFITADATSVNVLGLGAGSASLNGMTAVRILTSATNTTLNGTTALNVDVNGFTAMGKGTTAGTTILDLLGADNSTVLTIRINATQANVTAADTFVDFRSTSGSEGSIAGTAVAGVIAYNTFTGSHYTQIDDKTGIQVGMLLEMIDGDCLWPAVDKNVTQTTIIGDDEINEVNSGKTRTVSKQVNVKESPVEKSHLPKSRICQTRASKAGYGAYGGTDMLERDLCLSVGAGILFVANKGMDIEIGDYLMSSDVFGCAELQVLKDGSRDDVYRNITVAKSTQNVVWNIGEINRIVNVIYEGG